VKNKISKKRWFSEVVLYNMRESIIITNVDGVIIYVNKATEKLFGYTEKEMINQKPIMVNAEPDAEKIQESILEAMLCDGEWKGQLLNRKKNGDLFTVELTICLLKDLYDNLVGFIGYQKDVTKALKASKKIKESEEKFRKIFQNSPMGMHLYQLNMDDELVLIDSNPAADDFTGINTVDFIGKTLEEAFPVLIGTEIHERYKMAASKGISWNTSSFTYKDERINGIYDIWAYQISRNRVLVQFVEVVKREHVEEELRNRNQELEQFAYVASHDLQEPLRVVSNYCEMLSDKCKTCPRRDKDTEKWLEYITEAIDRMKNLIRELLDFSRVGRKDKSFESCNIGDIIEDVKDDFKILIKETDAVIKVEENMPSINCIEFRIRQLFYNLISNAIKFRGKKKPHIDISFYKEDDEYVFCVKDNGIGISPKYFDRIFGIFKRLYSREEYPGTGIGLALCKKIVETHNGRIWVDSKENKGASFYFTLSTVLESD